MQKFDRKVMLRVLRKRIGCFPHSQPRTRTLFIFAMVLFWCVTGSSLCGAGVLYKVNLFEVKLESSEPADVALKTVLQRHLSQSLEDSGHCHLVIVSTTMQSEIMKEDSLDRYLRDSNVTYVVKGSLVSLGDHLDVLVEVEDHSKKEVRTFKWHRTIKKDFETADRLFDNFARRVASVVEGTAQKEMVFAYCFFGLRARDEATAQFILFLPRKLEAALRARRDFARAYEVTGVPVTSLESECSASRDVEARLRQANLSQYEYVITGVVEEVPESGSLTLNVEVFSADVEQPTTLEPLQVKWGNQETLIQRLVAHIVNQWPRR